jgi:hypothetical protein
MYEVKKLTIDLDDLENLEEEEVFLIESEQPISIIPVKPSAATITSIESGDRKLIVNFVPPSTIGENPLITYQYTIDAGITWNYKEPAGLSSPIIIENLQSSTTYGVKIRAATKNNFGLESLLVYATTV